MTLKLRDDRFYAPFSAACAADGPLASNVGTHAGLIETATGPRPVLNVGGTGVPYPIAPVVNQPGPGILPMRGGWQLRALMNLECPAKADLATGAGVTVYYRDAQGGEVVRRWFFDLTGADPNPFAPLAATQINVSAAVTAGEVATALANAMRGVFESLAWQVDVPVASGANVAVASADDGEVSAIVELTAASGIVQSATQWGQRDLRLAPVRVGPLQSWVPCQHNPHTLASPA